MRNVTQYKLEIWKFAKTMDPHPLLQVAHELAWYSSIGFASQLYESHSMYQQIFPFCLSTEKKLSHQQMTQSSPSSLKQVSVGQAFLVHFHQPVPLQWHRLQALQPMSPSVQVQSVRAGGQDDGGSGCSMISINSMISSSSRVPGMVGV